MEKFPPFFQTLFKKKRKKNQTQLYLQIRQASNPNGVDCQVGASKAHKVSLLRQQAISEQPPGRKQRDVQVQQNPDNPQYLPADRATGGQGSNWGQEVTYHRVG